MGTVAGKEEVAGVIDRAGSTIRLVEQRVERRAQSATNQRTRTLGDVVAAVALVLLGIWVGRQR